MQQNMLIIHKIPKLFHLNISHPTKGLLIDYLKTSVKLGNLKGSVQQKLSGMLLYKFKSSFQGQLPPGIIF